jgi:hypothetical protein
MVLRIFGALTWQISLPLREEIRLSGDLVDRRGDGQQLSRSFAGVWVADHAFLRDHGEVRSAPNGSQRPLQFSGRKA